MKKKLLTLLMALTLSASIIACGGKKLPDGMSQDTYDTGIKALEIMDKYNDADIDADEADKRLEALSDKLDSLELSDDESAENSFVQSNILSFQSKLFLGGDTYTTADDLRKLLELD
ncbi:hypothetical protein HMPREF9477_00939 [Lachnospiraceae bacterium 2_1_46FAA]|jgi:hypothetical protein|nr:hypothetical protein HMPREF9477_00939 [Lachnospiraceae bacterium 2_1_46FAA]